MWPGTFPTDRRVLAAEMCRLLAHGTEDPNISLEQLGRVAQQIAEILLDDEHAEARMALGPRLRVIEGGRQ